MNDESTEYICTHCYSEYVNPARWERGHHTCMPCGDAIAKSKVRTIVPLHKSNYMLVTDTDLLTGINNKGGLVK